MRWFDISRDYLGNSIGLFVGGSLTESGSARETDVTPKFSLSYSASDDLTLYNNAESFAMATV